MASVQTQKTLLIGNFGAKNLGDELILAFALENEKNNVIIMTVSGDFSQHFCEKSFQTVSFFPTGFRSFYRFLTNKSYRKEILLLREEVEEIVFPGGGLFAISFRAVWLWFIVFLWVKYLFKEKKVRFEYQGIDANLGFFSRFLIKQVFSRVERVSVRDEVSAQAIESLSINGLKIKIEEDLVFEQLRERTGVNEEVEKTPILLLNALSEFSIDKWEDIEYKFSKLEKVFVCFDPKDKQFLPEGFSGRILFPKTKTDLFKLFVQAKTVIGERLHFLILGQYFCGSKQTFSLKDPYSQKVKNFCREKNINVFK